MPEASAKGDSPWWVQSAPATKLIRKVTLVEGEDVPNAEAENGRRWRLSVHTLTFEIPSNHTTFIEPAIPHSQVRIDLGDVVKMVIPNYKPKSYSISALRPNEFDVTFKAYPNGRASGFLDRLQVGDTIQSFGKSANRRRNAGSFIGIIAYGVGITEGLPIARCELEREDVETVVLLWASRTEKDTFWHEAIHDLSNKHGERFRIVHIFSKDQRPGCLKGRVNPDVLNQVFQPTDKEQARFLSVGTKEMMRITDEMLNEIGYEMPQHALLPKVKKNGI